MVNFSNSNNIKLLEFLGRIPTQLPYYLHTFWKLFIYISYIVRTIFPSIWCFFQMLIILFSFSILSKFASNSYALPIVITQINKITDFCIWFQQNSHKLFSTVRIAMLLTASSHIWKQHDLYPNPNYFTTHFIHRISHSECPLNFVVFFLYPKHL